MAPLHRRRQLLGAELEYLGQLLTRVAAATEEQGHALTVA
jgi:hypothetical protein